MKLWKCVFFYPFNHFMQSYKLTKHSPEQGWICVKLCIHYHVSQIPNPDRLKIPVCNPHEMLVINKAGEVTCFPLNYLLFCQTLTCGHTCFAHSPFFFFFSRVFWLFLFFSFAHFCSQSYSSSFMASAKSAHGALGSSAKFRSKSTCQSGLGDWILPPTGAEKGSPVGGSSFPQVTICWLSWQLHCFVLCSQSVRGQLYLPRSRCRVQ